MIESRRFTNPFPGLRPFETEEYLLFFGREGQSDALITRLQRARLLAVVGTSGSGKSSLVRAGLLPALAGGMMADAGSGWRIAILRPGSDPFSNLAQSLAEKDVLPEAGGGLPTAEAEAVIEATLRRGSLGLVDVVRQAGLPGHEKLLVVVDQFEELFRFRAAREVTSTGDDALAFVKLLLEAAHQREHSLYIVLTMRSDFLGDCAQFQGLPEAINDGQYLIPRMTRDERRMAITGPIGVARGRVAEPLVSRLLNDVGDNPDQLPILQHALMRTWDYWQTHRRNGEPLGVAHYEAIGTMSDALSKHADEAYDELPHKFRSVAEILFKALTERGADNREIRRPTRLKDICDLTGARMSEVIAVIDVFRNERRSFLMPPAGVELHPETIIDISHESLIRNWRRLRDWVKDEAESARIYRRLAEAAMDYQAGARGLLDDVTLQYVLKWREKSNPDRAWGVRYHPEFDAAIGYLEESRVARDKRVADEHDRERRELERARDFAEKQGRAARRLRVASVAMALLFIAASAGAVYAFRMKGLAEINQRKATEALTKLQTEERAKEAALEDAKTNASEARKEADRAEKQKTRADKQTVIAEKRALEAEAATRKAAAEQRRAEAAAKRERDKAEQLQLSMHHNILVRRGLEQFQRGDFGEAQAAFEELSQQSNQGLPSDQTQQLELQRGWAYSNIGSTQLKLEQDSKAVEAFEQARSILENSPEADARPFLLDTYSGLANAYHRVGLSLKDQPARRDEKYGKAEKFYKSSLNLQRELYQSSLKEQPVKKKLTEDVLAPRYANLARLYVDTGAYDKAEENFKFAISHRRLGKENRDLRGNERAALAAALRELAEFYQAREGCYDEAIVVLKEMIAVQEEGTLSELIDNGQEIANSYSDLGQIYKAMGEQESREADKVEGNAAANAKKAEALKQDSDDALRMANFLQRTSFKIRQMRKSQAPVEGSILIVELTADLDEMGNAYAKLGKLAYAEKIYLDALRQRSDSHNEQWKSYDRLAGFYGKSKKDPTKAEEYKNLLKTAIKDKPDLLMQLGELHADDPYSGDSTKPTDSEIYYKDGLAIYKRQGDWNGENKIFFRLSRLYLKQNRAQDRLQAQRDRVKAMSGYFYQLVMNSQPLPKDPVNLVYQYLYAINALAYGKSNVAADDTYRLALDAFDYIKGNINDKKVLEFYAATLEDYEKALKKMNKPVEAANVLEQAKVVRDRVRQLGPSASSP